MSTYTTTCRRKRKLKIRGVEEQKFNILWYRKKNEQETNTVEFIMD